MSQDRFDVSSGIKHLPVYMDGVDTARKVDYNPADNGFAESLYRLPSKLSQIRESKNKQYDEEADPAARFDISRAEDAEMREAVDSLFGDGFCRDVFKTRLFAMADGMTVVENFLFALLDEMDESITDNLSKRDARIKKYTEKYSRYKKYNN